MKHRYWLLAALLAAPALHAETPQDFLTRFEAEARGAQPGFAASAARGEKFFHAAGAADWRCSSCHTDNPAAVGKHATTAKRIDPLAPAANAERFVNPAKVDKWFKRNCKEVLERACSPSEKADLMAYLITVKR